MNVTLTLFERPDRPQGRKLVTSWREVIREGALDSDAETKDALGQWSAAEFSGDYRSAVRVQRIHAVVLDADDGVTIEAASDALGDFAHWIHTTWSHTEESPRLRIVIPLARPVTLEGWPDVQTYAADRVGRVDRQASSCAHAWLRPAPHRPGFRSQVHAIPSLLEPRDVPRRSRVLPDISPPPMRRPPPRIVDRAARYLERMDGAVSGAGGHAACFRAAVALRRGFELDEATAYDLLASIYNPRCDPPWSERELLHKVRSAGRARIEAGYLLGGER